MAKDIWIIVRTQGEYSDRSEDAVCWFDKEKDAQDFCVKVQGESRDAAQRWQAFCEEKDWDYQPSDVDQFMKGLSDPTFSPSSYGAVDVSYFVQILPYKKPKIYEPAVTS